MQAWREATAARPAGICGPIGPTEQLPLVAQIVNDLGIEPGARPLLGHGRVVRRTGRKCPSTHPLSFAKADMDLCFKRIDPKLRMPGGEPPLPARGHVKQYTASYDQARCLVMQGGQGEVKHWAFNDPLRREGKYADDPPTPAEYRALTAPGRGPAPHDHHPEREDLGRRRRLGVPSQALSVGPVETWKSERVSIWHAGGHDNPFGMRLTALMISRRRSPTRRCPCPCSRITPTCTSTTYRGGIGTCEAEIDDFEEELQPRPVDDLGVVSRNCIPLDPGRERRDPAHRACR